VGALHLTAEIVPVADATGAIQNFLAQPIAPHSYRATRRLEATGSGQRGWLDVRTDFTPAGGLNYEVTAEGGSGYIRSRVLRTLLEEERRVTARGESSRVAISPETYTFTGDGVDENGLARVEMRPLRKERPLIVGRLFLTPEDGELVRVEGRLARNPSFWKVGRMSCAHTAASMEPSCPYRSNRRHDFGCSGVPRC